MRYCGRPYQPFRDRLVAVVGETFSDPYLKAVACVGAEDAWISAAAASRVLGVRPDRIVEAIAAGAIDGRIHRSGLGHRHCSLAREAVAAIAKRRARFRDDRSIASMLGRARRQVRAREAQARASKAAASWSANLADATGRARPRIWPSRSRPQRMSRSGSGRTTRRGSAGRPIGIWKLTIRS
jgi:hypothetical protein